MSERGEGRCEATTRSESEKRGPNAGEAGRPGGARMLQLILRGRHLERVCCDPKDGELCLCRTKPGETLVEVRTNTDVQIVCQI